MIGQDKVKQYKQKVLVIRSKRLICIREIKNSFLSLLQHYLQ